MRYYHAIRLVLHLPNISECLSVYIYIYIIYIILSIFESIIYVWIFLSTYLSMYLWYLCEFIYQSICLSIILYVSVSILLSVYQSIYIYIYIYINIPILNLISFEWFRLSFCLPVSLSAWPRVVGYTGVHKSTYFTIGQTHKTQNTKCSTTNKLRQPKRISRFCLLKRFFYATREIFLK